MNANTLIISHKFTIKDIHNVRENNYILKKDIFAQEKRDHRILVCCYLANNKNHNNH